MKFLKAIYRWRFHIFFFSQLLVLFGSLLVPFEKILLEAEALHKLVLSLFMLGNLIAGLTIIFRRKKLFYFLISLIVIELLLALQPWLFSFLDNLRVALFVILYLVLFVEIISQIIQEQKVGVRVILGMFSGYVTLGFIGLFLLQLIMQGNPDAISFSRDIPGTTPGDGSQLMYFSFITLLTIGYGDIVPNSMLAQKTVVLLGLAGQFYLTTVIAFIVGKYLRD
ncbi:ion channel [Robertkochia sediminum]|uniref:ion channel n=1 Tax=Robertkochia sediminum TaxID=2785326 RepID=UPI0019336238|nr:ion channel [Robertkochia sediminum]MBL7471436.1 two pore domain potassium channel family protein [Robertkochia sediminum]